MVFENRNDFLDWLDDQLSEHKQADVFPEHPLETLPPEMTAPAAFRPNEIYDKDGNLIASNRQTDSIPLWGKIRSIWNGMSDGEKCLAVGTGLLAVSLLGKSMPAGDTRFMTASFSADPHSCKYRIGISTLDGVQLLWPLEIIYMTAIKNKGTLLHLTDERQVKTCTRIGEIEKNLCGYPEFLRIHNSHIVNTTYLSRFRRGDCVVEMHKSHPFKIIAPPSGHVVRTRNYYTVSVGETYRDALVRRLERDVTFL